VARIALGHHVGWLEARVGNLGHREGLVVRLLRRDDWRVRGHHEVDTWVWHQVSLELSDVDVECTIETKGGSQGGHNLSDNTVEVGVCWALDVEATTADVVHGLVVKHDGNVGVLEESMGGEDGIVRLHDGCGDLRGWVHAESELGLLAVIDRKTLEEESTKTGAGTTSYGVEEHEPLEASALVCELAQAIKGEVHDFLADGVMTTGIVIRGILLAGDQLLWMVELAVCAGTDLVDHGWFEIEVDATGHVFAGTSLTEKGVERIIATANGLVGRHLAIRLNAVLEAVKLPAGVTDLDTGLANVDGDNLTHFL